MLWSVLRPGPHLGGPPVALLEPPRPFPLRGLGRDRVELAFGIHRVFHAFLDLIALLPVDPVFVRDVARIIGIRWSIPFVFIFRFSAPLLLVWAVASGAPTLLEQPFLVPFPVSGRELLLLAPLLLLPAATRALLGAAMRGVSLPLAPRLLFPFPALLVRPPARGGAGVRPYARAARWAVAPRLPAVPLPALAVGRPLSLPRLVDMFLVCSGV